MSRIAQSILIVLLLAFSGAVVAKDAKITVKVHVDEEITNLNNGGDVSAIGTAHSFAQYFNVTVVPDAATATPTTTTTAPEPLANDGKWCLKSPSDQTIHLTKDGTYDGYLNGSFIHLQLPQTKGKPVDVSFSVFDKKWRSRLDIR